jgi:hypothetical protein
MKDPTQKIDSGMVLGLRGEEIMSLEDKRLRAARYPIGAVDTSGCCINYWFYGSGSCGSNDIGEVLNDITKLWVFACKSGADMSVGATDIDEHGIRGKGAQKMSVAPNEVIG